jgi:hypothetical protein
MCGVKVAIIIQNNNIITAKYTCLEMETRMEGSLEQLFDASVAKKQIINKK